MNKAPLKFIAFCLLVIQFLFFNCAYAQQESGKIVIETIDRGFQILEDSKYQQPENFAERRQKLWEILEPVFNFEEISKRALGRYWKEISAEEKKEFTAIFTDILKDGYLGQSDKYTKQKFTYLQEAIEGARSRVQTQVTTDDEKNIAVDILLLKTGESWKVYDILVEGVSMVGNYRSQFDSILSKSSFTELMQKMKDKKQELSQILLKG